MAMTTLGDLFSRNPVASTAVMQSYMDADPVTRTPFFESGLLVNDPIVQQIAGESSDAVMFPFWNDIDASVEPNYSNDVYEDIAVPRAISTGTMRARRTQLSEGFGAMDFVRFVTGEQPLQRIAQRLGVYWRSEIEYRVLATLRGLYNLNVAGDGDMVFDAGATPTYSALIDAHLTMGDNFGAVGGYVTHSKVFAAFVKEKLAETNFDSEANIMRGSLNGLPVIVNDRAMTVGTGADRKAITVAMGAGAFAYGMANAAVAEEFDREPERGNGGGAETLWSRRNVIIHPFGYDFTSDSITGNGTETVARGAGWADLANTANWARVVDRTKVPLAFMSSNFPAT